MPDTQNANPKSFLDPASTQVAPALGAGSAGAPRYLSAAPLISNDNHPGMLARYVLRLAPFKTAFLGFAAGACVALFAMLNGTEFYQSQSRFYVDAKQFQSGLSGNKTVVDPSVEAKLLNDKKLEAASQPVLEDVIARLGLGKEKLFDTSRDTGMLSEASNWYRSLFQRAPVTMASTSDAGTVEQLEQALQVDVEANAPVIAITVTTTDARNSALIANQIVDVLKDRNNSTQPARTVNPSELDALLAKVQKADQEVADYVSRAAAVPPANETTAIAGNLADLRDRLSVVRKNLDQLKKAGSSVEALLALPSEVLGPKLAALKDQLRNAQTQADQLALNLGPKHPDLQAAQKVVAGLVASFVKDVPALVKATEADLDKKKAAEAQLAKDLESHRAVEPEMVQLPPSGPSLEELQKAAETAHAEYASMLAAGSERKIPEPLIRMISKAVVADTPLHADGLTMAFAIIIGGLCGLVLVEAAVYLKPEQQPVRMVLQTIPEIPSVQVRPAPVKEVVPVAPVPPVVVEARPQPEPVLAEPLPDPEELERLTSRLQRLALLLDQAQLAADDEEEQQADIISLAQPVAAQPSGSDLYERVYSKAANGHDRTMKTIVPSSVSPDLDVYQVRNELRALKGRVLRYAGQRA